MSGPTLVQTSSIVSRNGSSGNTLTTNLTGVTAGNLIIVYNIRGADDASAPTLSVSDGTAYTNAVQKIAGTGSTQTIGSIDFLPNAAAGSHSIVSTNSAGSFNDFGYQIVEEWSGILATSPLDVSVSATGTSATAASGSTGTLAQASELVVALTSMLGATNVTLTTPSGFTDVTGSKNQTASTYTDFAMGLADHQIVSATTALSPSWGAMGTSPLWVAMAASFKAIGAVIESNFNLDGNVNGNLSGGFA